MNRLCEYGCDNNAIIQLKNSKWCCSKSSNSCPENRRKNSEKRKGQDKGKIFTKKICPICQKQIVYYCFEKHLQGHNNPLLYKHNKKCKYCGMTFNTKEKHQMFCSRSCSAKYSNNHRIYNPTEDKRTKTGKCRVCDKIIVVNIRTNLIKIICEQCSTIPFNNICQSCGIKFTHKIKLKYCSEKCKKYKGKRTKIGYCKKCNKQIEVNIRTNIKRVYCVECRNKKLHIKQCSHCGIEFKHKLYDICKTCRKIQTCEVCKKEFSYNTKRKTCSDKCNNKLISIKACKRVNIKGTNNFKTKQENFSYKFVKNIPCDSKLEIAGIKYLIDEFKADKIECYNNILNYKEEGKHKTFNPDFWVIKNEQVYIVEVKMKWYSNSEHNYYKSIPYKKKALQKYCNDHNYKMIWLDYDYDSKLRKIYRQVLKCTN